MTMNKTSILSESSSSSSLTQPPSHGLRTQLGHVLPKHSLFHVCLHVDQLSNVPLVSGEFAVRWKFRNVQSGAGLLSKMKNRSTSSSSLHIGKKVRGKGKDTMEFAPEIAVENASGSTLSCEDHVDRPYRQQPPHDVNGAPVYGQYLTTSPPGTPLPPAATLTSEMSVSRDKVTDARGMTEWIQLKNYAVRWDQRVDVLVQMDVHRESCDLLPCELKLVVMQRVVQGDPNAPHHPRLGAVYLNLAEYAAVGPVTRSYLLRESKTNATLKVRTTLSRTDISYAYNSISLPSMSNTLVARRTLRHHLCAKAKSWHQSQAFFRTTTYTTPSLLEIWICTHAQTMTRRGKITLNAHRFSLIGMQTVMWTSTISSPPKGFVRLRI